MEANCEVQRIVRKDHWLRLSCLQQDGFGFLESVYEKCLLIELAKAGLQAEAQKEITFYYENEVVGEFIADVVVENLVILELKSVKRIVKAHEVQLVNYLTATYKDVGLILNFGEKGVEVKRKVRDLNDLRGQSDWLPRNISHKNE